MSEQSDFCFRAVAIVWVFAIVTSSCRTEPIPESLTEDNVEWALLDVDQEVIVTGYAIPWAIEILAEEEYLFTERLGNLLYFKDGTTKELSGIPEVMTVENSGLTYGGLMDVSLHPDFSENGLVYVAYVNENGIMAVGRFDFSGRAVEDFEVIFESNTFSIGSRIIWDNSRHFYVSHGMGGSPDPDPGPQDLSHDSGKIHRLMEDGSIPDDNPIFDGFSDPTSIWSYGHRDPQGLYFDREEEVLYSTEHGPLGGDELNIVTKAGNYGWPLYSNGLNYDRSAVSSLSEEEASQQFVMPLKTWGPQFNMAPSGLEKLEESLFTDLNGSFLLGSLAQQRLIAYSPESGRTSILLDRIGRVRDVAQLPSGGLLILLDYRSPKLEDSGRIVKITPKLSPPVSGG